VCWRLPLVVDFDEPRKVPRVPHIPNGERAEHGNYNPDYVCHRCLPPQDRFTIDHLSIIFNRDTLGEPPASARFRSVEVGLFRISFDEIHSDGAQPLSRAIARYRYYRSARTGPLPIGADGATVVTSGAVVVVPRSRRSPSRCRARPPPPASTSPRTSRVRDSISATSGGSNSSRTCRSRSRSVATFFAEVGGSASPPRRRRAPG